MAGPPSLDLLMEVTAAELAAQAARGDALDTKAGTVLGFAGVLVTLSVASLHGWLAHTGAVIAAVSALLAAAAFMPRSFPTVGLKPLRDRYLMAEPQLTLQRLLDTRIAVYTESRAILKRKAALVMAGTWALGIAVVLSVIAGIVVPI